MSLKTESRKGLGMASYEGVDLVCRAGKNPSCPNSGLGWSRGSGQVLTSWCRPWMSRMSLLVTDQWKVRPGTALPKEKGFWLLVIPVM